MADEGTQALQKSWKASDVALRDHLTKTNNKAWEVIKARAAKVPATVTA